jgi:gamma-glutamyltranspeptidase/glutathione hydrolase
MTCKRFAALFFVVVMFVAAPVAPVWQSAHVLSVASAASRDPVRARHGMVASTNKLASEAGVEILRRGGNAVDAAIATAFALAVVHPAAGNLGGGGFMMIRLRDGRATAIDYREMAPAAASHDVYLDKSGALIKGEGSSTMGYRAAGVPGTPAGMALALKKYGSGKLTWSQLIEPARQLAANGFAISNGQARSFRAEKDLLERYEDSRRIFLNGGKFYEEGATLRQPELAATFARMQRGGAREFYEGETAHLIADDMKRHNGLITLADMKAYEPKERVPLETTYRGYKVISMPPPSSGGAVLIEMLNILEGFDLRAMQSASSE